MPCYRTYGRSRVMGYHSREIGPYTTTITWFWIQRWIINWRPGGTRNFGCGLGWAIERGSGCISPAYVDQGLYHWLDRWLSLQVPNT